MSKKPILSKRIAEGHSLSRYEREMRIRKYVIIGSVVVTFLVLLLVVAAVLQELVFEPNRGAASVNGETITAAQVRSRMKLEFADIGYNYNQLAQQVQQLQASKDDSSAFLVQYYQQQLQQVAARGTVAQVANTSMDALIDELLIRQEAKRRNISVSSDEVQQDVETSMGFYRSTLTPFPTITPFTPEPTATPLTVTLPITPVATEGPLPTATPRLQPTTISQAELEQSRERGVKFYQDLGYSKDQFSHVYETSLLTRRLQEAFAAETPKQAQHYKFEYIRFNTVATATEYLDLLRAGKLTFQAAITAANTITQPEAIGSGFSRDWTSKAIVESQFGNEVLAALESQPVETLGEVITSSLTGGFFVLLPHGRETRDLTEEDLKAAQQKMYSDWLTAARTDEKAVKRDLQPVDIMPNDLRKNIENFQQQVSQQG